MFRNILWRSSFVAIHWVWAYGKPGTSRWIIIVWKQEWKTSKNILTTRKRQIYTPGRVEKGWGSLMVSKTAFVDEKGVKNCLYQESLTCILHTVDTDFHCRSEAWVVNLSQFTTVHEILHTVIFPEVFNRDRLLPKSDKSTASRQYSAHADISCGTGG